MKYKTDIIKVRYSETDQMGIVHHSNYLKFFELARIEWLEKKSNPPSWQGPVTFAGGVVIGMATVALSAWTLDKIQEN